MVGHDLLHLAKPEGGNLVENVPFAGNPFIHNDIEGGDAIGGDDQQVLPQVVDVANLATPDEMEVGKVGFKQDGHGRSFL
jgi:hypothetical protein